MGSRGARVRLVGQALKYKALAGFSHRFSPAPQNVMADWRLADVLYRMGCYEEALRHLAPVADQLSELPPMRPLALRTRGQQGSALFVLGRYRESIEIFDLVIAMRSEVPGMLADPGLQSMRLWDWVADAMALKVGALKHLDQKAEAEAANEALIDAFDPGTTAQQRWIIATAFLGQGRFARARGDLEGALAALEQACLRAPVSESESFARTHCMALFERCEVLEQAERNVEAIAACDELVSRFSSTGDSDIKEAVRDALRLKSRLAVRVSGNTGA